MSPTLFALRAGRAYTWPPLALTPSVAQWRSGKPSCALAIARVGTPKDAPPRMPLGQSPVHLTPVRAQDDRGSGCLRLTRPHLSVGQTVQPNVIVHDHTIQAPFSRARGTGLVRVPDPYETRYPTTPTPRCDALAAGQMPLSSLLQPTCCHVQPDEHSPSRLGGSRPSDRPTIALQSAGWVSPTSAKLWQQRRWLTIAGASSPG